MDVPNDVSMEVPNGVSMDVPNGVLMDVPLKCCSLAVRMFVFYVVIHLFP
jgi:hypothetical protein